MIAYDDFHYCMSEYILWIKEQINKSEKGFIRIRRSDLAKALDDRLFAIGHKRRGDYLLYNIIKIILFDENIFVQQDKYDDKKTFLMRNKRPEDNLNKSLKNYRRDTKKMIPKRYL